MIGEDGQPSTSQILNKLKKEPNKSCNIGKRLAQIVHELRSTLYKIFLRIDDIKKFIKPSPVDFLSNIFCVY